MFFGVGAIISILFLSIGNNKLSNTFIAYADSYNLQAQIDESLFCPSYKNQYMQ
jgi:hypothetical protein